jgi:hypothetical protein
MKPNINVRTPDREEQIRKFLQFTRNITHSLTIAEIEIATHLILKCSPGKGSLDEALKYSNRADIRDLLDLTEGNFNTSLSRIRSKGFIKSKVDSATNTKTEWIDDIYTLPLIKNFNLVIGFSHAEEGE